MAQDATKIVLAAALSNHKDIACFDVDPANFLAGSCVSLASTGLPSLLESAGMRYGVSRGKSLSDDKKTAIQQAGLRVPVLASLQRATGVITVTSYANLVAVTPDTVTVAGTAFTAQSGAATPGDATFRAATDNNATAVSLAAQINSHATVSLKVYAVVTSSAVVTLYSVAEGIGSTGTGNDIALAYADLGTATVGITLSGLSAGKLSGGSDTVSDAVYIVAGLKMYINKVTGKADIAMSGFSTVSDATYVSTAKTGVAEDASEVCAAIVDMQGGL